VRARLVAAALLVTALGGIVAGCGTATSGSDGEAAAQPDASPTVTTTATPTPVDPDQEFVDAMKSTPAFGEHLSQGATQMQAWTNATSLDEGATTSHAVADTFDWLADYADADPTSADSPVAQDTMESFRFCRDTYQNVGDAIDNVDPEAMNNSSTDIQECTRGLEGIMAKF
jgi:hypothetical protein